MSGPVSYIYQQDFKGSDLVIPLVRLLKMELKGTFITTIAELREILNSTDRTILIYFYAEWSPTCRRIRFEFTQAETNNPDVIYLAANVDNAKGLLHKLDMTLDDIPAVVVFREGKMVHSAKHIKASDFDNVYFPAPEEEWERLVERTTVSSLD